MGRDISLDEVVEHFTLDGGDLELIRDKAGRLGFSVMLKYLLWRGRFPRGRHEIPDDAIAHVARQIGVSAGDMGFYDVTNRQASNHRAEIRRHTGFSVCTVADADKLALWLADGVARDGRSADQVRAELLRHCKAGRIEPPTADRVRRIVESGIRQADDALVALVVSRLGTEHLARVEALVGNAAVPGAGGGADGEYDEGESEPDVLASIKTDPGNVSLASMLTEITKLEAVRAVGLPTTLFTGISPKVVVAWRARAAVESPSHLRRHAQPVRLVLLAALLYQRQQEITDTLVELLSSCVHKINAHAEKKVTEEFVRQYKRIRNKDAMLQQVAEVSLESPAEPVRDVIYPVMGGEAGLTELVREYRARRAYERDKRRVFKSSYTNHYRTGLIKLLQVLEFRSNNTEHQPVLDGLKLILRYAEAKTTFYPRGETVVLEGVLKEDWREFAVSADHRGRARVVRHVYECCVLIALRDRLRCKEIWVVGADKWRNPDDDLPADFDDKRTEHYEQLNLPLDAKMFTTAIRDEMRAELGQLNTVLPTLP